MPKRPRLCVLVISSAAMAIGMPVAAAATRPADLQPQQHWCQSRHVNKGMNFDVGRWHRSKAPIFAAVADVAQTFRGTITRRGNSPLLHVSGKTWGEGRQKTGLSFMSAVVYWPEHSTRPLWVNVRYPGQTGKAACKPWHRSHAAGAT